ncbi:hypothetical protein ACIB24_08815 [Spongisporangium articulatum]|uniref:Uncharacterized protein n=1 Tax=Spongisporangium articulatum TaxID=3362603 RepID=A0ABW8ALD3_9ACTN
MPKTKAPESPLSAPVTLSTREVLPPLPLTAGVLAFGLSCIGLAAARPKKIPPLVQIGADAVTATLLLHPLEVAGVSRLIRRRDLSVASRRKVQGSVLVFGAFSLLPVRRAVRRAPKLSR